MAHEICLNCNNSGFFELITLRLLAQLASCTTLAAQRVVVTYIIIRLMSAPAETDITIHSCVLISRSPFISRRLCLLALILMVSQIVGITACCGRLASRATQGGQPGGTFQARASWCSQTREFNASCFDDRPSELRRSGECSSPVCFVSSATAQRSRAVSSRLVGQPT